MLYNAWQSKEWNNNMPEKTTYDKLVRDRIPEIIRESGAVAETRSMSEGEYVRALEQKLDEEVAEFHESKTIEELADILEVVFALAKSQDVSADELEQLRLSKREARGGFEERIFLLSTIS